MQKVLTISVAAYNVEKFLKNTLDSLVIPELTGKYEVIIVNDGSTDNTEKIAKEYVDKWPLIFKVIDKENGGWGSTINTSIKAAGGKYFKQLDGDDWFEKKNLKDFVNELEKIDTDMVITPFNRYNEGDGQKEVADYEDVPNAKIGKVNDICRTEYIEMHAATFKTQLLKNNNRKITEHCFYTDVEYTCIPIVEAETYYKIPMDIYCYRIGYSEQSVSLKSYVKRIEDYEKVCRKMLDFYQEIRCKRYSKEKINYIKRKVQDMSVQLYRFYSLSELDKKKLNKIKWFDKDIKEQGIYQNIKLDNTIKLFRMNNFRFSKIVSKINRIRYRKDLQ